MESTQNSAVKESSTKTAKVKEQNICDICKKSFCTKTYLKFHFKTVHDEVKKHKCEICGKLFALKSYLRCHVKTVHNQIKSHECVSCDKRFGQKRNLEKHMKTVHEKINQQKSEIHTLKKSQKSL